MTYLGSGSPTVRRIRLGLLLKSHRERAGLSVEHVAASLETTPRSVLRWESGRSNIHMGHLATLLDDLYKVTGAARDELVQLAKEARQRGWWTPYTSSVRPTFATFLGLEAAATSYMEYSAMLLPGLLQTERYMRAVMINARPTVDRATIERRIELRHKRQAEMFARDYPHHFVIDEGCLMRRVGNFDVMREQLQYILDLDKPDLVTIQVAPFEEGVFASTLGSFSVLTFADMPPIACIELMGGDLYADGTDSETYTEHFDKLRESALTQAETRDLIDVIMREVHHAR